MRGYARHPRAPAPVQRNAGWEHFTPTPEVAMRTMLVALAIALAAVVAPALPLEAQAGPTIAVSRSTGLNDGDTVNVTGADWSSRLRLVGIFVCDTAVYNAAPAAGGNGDARFDYIFGRCGDFNVYNVPTSGQFAVQYLVRRGTANCGNQPGDCVIYAMAERGSGVFSTNAVPVSFATPPPPTCLPTSRSASGIAVDVQAKSGLRAIDVTTSANANVVVPSFTNGTTDPVHVTATKIDPTRGSQVALRVTDLKSAVSECDPVIATLSPRKVEVFSEIPAADRFLTVVNTDPGLRRIVVKVARHTEVIKLRRAETTLVDLARLVPATDHAYAISLRGVGRGPAQITISDGGAAMTPANPPKAAMFTHP